jgi:hypothetical protein
MITMKATKSNGVMEYWSIKFTQTSLHYSNTPSSLLWQPKSSNNPL